MHEGSVTADSKGPGQGSVFSLRLPARPARAESARPKAKAKDSEHPTNARRILVVDDNEDAAELLAFALEAAGHETRIAHDGPSALLALDQFAADAALLDIGLPGMDGYELANRIRRQSVDVRLIAITGYGQDADRKRASDAGFHSHLVKPVDLQLVLRAVREVALEP
jgi:CheY-like chemotaxis protein